MTMIDLKITEEEKKESAQKSVISDQEQYPHGLILNVDASNAEKLGVVEPPKVGDEMIVLAKVSVRSVFLDENVDGKKKCSFSLQVKEMGLKAKSEEKEEKDAGEMLYGKD